MSQSVVEFTSVTPDHVKWVAENMRRADVTEVYEASTRTPLEALERGVKRAARNATILLDGEPVTIFGVGAVSRLSTTGFPWMLGTDQMKRRARCLLPHGPEALGKMMNGYDVLINMVHVDNAASQRWLRGLGFTLHDPKPLGWRGAMFRPFTMTKDEMNV